MEFEYDLAALAEDLTRTIPEISELYLFGSRARGTKSSRSDVDVLVVSESDIKPRQLREFSFEKCKALDLFVVNGGRATSSQNESFISADSFQDLLATLSAVKIWSRNEGRAQADIEWRFKIREDVEFIATALPNTNVMNTANQSDPLDPSRLTLKEILGSMTTRQLWAVICAFAILLGVALWLGAQLGSSQTPPPLT